MKNVLNYVLSGDTAGWALGIVITLMITVAAYLWDNSVKPATQSTKQEYFIYNATTGNCYIASPIEGRPPTLEPFDCNDLAMKIQFEAL